jgi:hypothetical protein
VSERATSATVVAAVVVAAVAAAVVAGMAAAAAVVVDVAVRGVDKLETRISKIETNLKS